MHTGAQSERIEPQVVVPAHLRSMAPIELNPPPSLALQPAGNQKNQKRRRNIARSRPLPPLPPQFRATVEVGGVVRLPVATALIWRLEVEVGARHAKNLIQNQTIEVV